jgi:hypothetical protein
MYMPFFPLPFYLSSSFLETNRVRDFYYDAIERVRKIRPELPIILHDSFRPYKWGTMFKNWPFENVYMDNHAYHSFNIADIASENPKEDRQKQYVHEKIACSYKSQLHFQTCNVVPVLVGEFSIAIDNCMPHLDARFADYGQCRDLASRLESPWWIRHIKSFAMRQIATAERELGWSFWTYKLDTKVEATEPASYFWSFRLAAKKGFVDKSFYGRRDACLYAPVSDWELGDEGMLMGGVQHVHEKKNTTSYLRKGNQESEDNESPEFTSSPDSEDKASSSSKVISKNEDRPAMRDDDDDREGEDQDKGDKGKGKDENDEPMNPADEVTDPSLSGFNTLSNVALVVVMVFFIGAIGLISHQRLRDVVSSVSGGYSTIHDPEGP